MRVVGERGETQSTYRDKDDRPPFCYGLRNRIQRAHLRRWPICATRFGRAAAGNLAVLEVVEERDDDHGRQDHVDNVADCRDGVVGGGEEVQ